MKRPGKTLGSAFAVLLLILVVGITFTVGWRPFIGPRARPLTARKFQSTPQRLARGEYIAERTSDCMECHSEHDWTAHDAPVLPNTLGAGEDMSLLKGLPGKVYAPNITPDAETGAATGATINWPAPFAKVWATMAGRYFPSCRMRISIPCPMKIWPP